MAISVIKVRARRLKIIDFRKIKGAVARKRKQFKFELHNEGVSETIVRAMCMRIVRVYARAHR